MKPSARATPIARLKGRVRTAATARAATSEVASAEPFGDHDHVDVRSSP